MILDAAATGRVLNVAISVAVCSLIPFVSSCSLDVLPPQRSDIGKRPDHFAEIPRSFLDPADRYREQLAFDDQRTPGGVERFILRLAKQVTDALFHEHWVSQAETPGSRAPDGGDKKDTSLDGNRANSQTVEVARSAIVRSAIARRRATTPNRSLTSKTRAAPSITKKEAVKASPEKLLKRRVETRIAQEIQKGGIEEIYFPTASINQVTRLRKSDRHERRRTVADTNLAPSRPRTAINVASRARTVHRSTRPTDSGLTPTAAVSTKRRSAPPSSSISGKRTDVSRKGLKQVATASRSEWPTLNQGRSERALMRPSGDATKEAQPDLHTTPTGRFVVQIASLPTESAALEYWKIQKPKIRSIIGNTNHRIRRIRLADDRIFHRVQVGPYRRSASAWGICRMLRAAGRSCFVVPVGAKK